MLPFVLVSFRHGVKWGLFTGLVNGCLQMLLGFWAPPTPTFIYFLGEVLLDYLVAFMALGMAELFARPFKNRMVGVAVGTAVAGFLRFMCSFLSGVLVWGNLNDGLSCLDLQPGLQRQLHAARNPAHRGGRCAADPCGTRRSSTASTRKACMFHKKRALTHYSIPAGAVHVPWRGFFAAENLSKNC